MSVGEDVKRLEPLCTGDGKAKCRSHCAEQLWCFLQKLKIELPYGLAIPLLGVHPKELKTRLQRDICTSVFLVVLFTVAKRCKQPRHPLMDELIKCDMYLRWTIIQPQRRKEMLPHETARVNLKNITLSEISPSQKTNIV